MSISILALVMGLLLSAVGGYFSVVGLATIFSGAYWSVVVMASTLELSKIVAASWIYRCWKIAPILIRTYMILAVIVLVAITSMGIFGYLSKAHVEQTIMMGGTNTIRIESIDRQIERERRTIDDSELVITQLDDAVSILQEYDRIRGPDGAIAVRQSQQEERDTLMQSINAAEDRIGELEEQKMPLLQEQLTLETEIGPLKYIAEAVYGENAESYFNTAVRWIIFILVSVFDPLAIVLILAGNTGLMNRPKRKIIVEEEKIATGMEIDEENIVSISSTEGHGLD